MTVTEQFTSAQLFDLPALKGWIGIRRHFGIDAFGVNAWKGDRAGDRVIGEHTESTLGHEELYLVVEGHAEFTLDGEALDAPRGTLVFVRDPEVRRAATAKEDGTLVLTIGAKPGEAFTPSPWEASAEAFPLFEQGEYARAKELLEAEHLKHPAFAGVLYNLACAEARLGDKEAALEHLREALEKGPEMIEYARTDEDFDSIRDDPRFASAIAGKPDSSGSRS